MIVKNRVISGDYSGCYVMNVMGTINIFGDGIRPVPVDRQSVLSYGVLGYDLKASGLSWFVFLTTAALASINPLFAPVALITLASIFNNNIRTVRIIFCDGKYSLMKLDGRTHKRIERNLYK